VHGEHGRDVEDLDGSSRRHQWMRRAYSPFVHRYVALSRDLAGYLTQRVGIRASRVEQVYNGVDTIRFATDPLGRRPIPGCPFGEPAHWLVGTVGRMQTVKDQTLLARAFVMALSRQPALRHRLRLVMVGDGPLREAAQAILDEGGAADLAWLPGERADVPDVMRGLDCFVLPSRAEGISNTILEAMASALPVVATRVGGNAELVDEGRTGCLVPSGNVDAMAGALIKLATGLISARSFGLAGRVRVERHFSLRSMVASYQRLYDNALTQQSNQQ
jgi:sugar transferase (PEP-CTERM/EpsH1 system associated)